MSFAPMLLSIVGTVASAVGTVASAVGTMQQASAASAAASYNAQIAERDIVVADQNRRMVLDQANIDAADKRRENRRTLSSIRAAYGASGLELAGSPLDVLEDTAVEQELDAQRIQFEGKVRAREGALQMLGLSESATLSRMEASSAKKSGMWATAGAIASGAGNILQRMN